MNLFESIIRRIKRTFSLSSAALPVRILRPVYNLFLNVIYFRRGLKRVINKQETIRIRPEHRYVSEEYEEGVYEELKKAVKPDAVVLEVGAHVGIFTILMARWAGPGGRIHAFEPTPKTRAALEEHLRLNELSERVTIIPSAVSDACGSMDFYVVSNSPENTLSPSHTRLKNAAAIRINVTTIDNYCEENSIIPSVIKIDIEGYELHALRGAKHILQKYSPVIVVEMHPMNWPEIGVERAQAEKILSEISYEIIPLDSQIDSLSEYGHILMKPKRPMDAENCE